MDERTFYLRKFRRILQLQAQGWFNCPEVEQLYSELAPAMRRIKGLDDYIHTMTKRLAQDGSWLPGCKPGPGDLAPTPQPATPLRIAPVAGSVCHFCGARMRPVGAPRAWRCIADPWHAFWINSRLPKGRQGVWLGHVGGSQLGPVPDWALLSPPDDSPSRSITIPCRPLAQLKTSTGKPFSTGSVPAATR